MQRFFLVGCPRSGTTIFQSLISSHPEVATFPETKLFQYAVWENFKHLFPERVHKFFACELKRPELLLDYKELQPFNWKISWFLGKLDGLAREEEKAIWLEKTPEHVFFISEIQRFLPEAKFVHITRNPLDTIASLWEATRMEGGQLWGGPWSLNQCITRWKMSNAVSDSYRENNSHLIVEYEKLLADKVKVLTECCHFMGIEYRSEMIEKYKFQALKLGMQHPWHEGIDRPVEGRAIPKFKQVFQEHEIEYILKQLEN